MPPPHLRKWHPWNYCMISADCMRVCVVPRLICPVFTTLSLQLGFKQSCKQSAINTLNHPSLWTHSPLILIISAEAIRAAKSLQSSRIDCLASWLQITKETTAKRVQPLPWGRTGHGAPPCRWPLGSPGPQCSCCRSSPCSGSGPFWNPEGLNGWWCLGILQGKTIKNNLRICKTYLNDTRCKLAVNDLQCRRSIYPRPTVLSVRNIHCLCNTQFMPFCVCLCLWIWSAQS